MDAWKNAPTFDKNRTGMAIKSCTTQRTCSKYCIKSEVANKRRLVDTVSKTPLHHNPHCEHRALQVMKVIV
jgi:hypothetical protein